MKNDRPDAGAHLARAVLRIRVSQLVVNEMLKRKELRIPVHLALGHEAIAAAVDAAMTAPDVLCVTHRNLHYNLARSSDFRAKVRELRLEPDGLAGGSLGCMNLADPAHGVVYTSSILGNDLCVASGIALASRVKGDGGVTFVATGDGAIEEGAFYESLLLMSSTSSAAVVVVENNGWSLATRIEERRCRVDLDRLAQAFGLVYRRLSGNDVVAYAGALRDLRDAAATRRQPVVVEVPLTTLGDRTGPPTPQEPGGKFINYHAGAAGTTTLEDWPLLRASDADPVAVLTRSFPEATLRDWAADLRRGLEEDAR